MSAENVGRDDGAKDDAAASSSRRLWFAFIPVAVFAALAAMFAAGLTNKDPRKIPSVLIGKPVPEFNLPAVEGMVANGRTIPGLKSDDLKAGKVHLVNVWASWCAPCRQEHPHLMALARENTIDIVGINYKDAPENAKRFLGTLGNPYVRVGADSGGSSAVEWGVIAVPETFLVDQKGIIRYKWIGPLTERALKEELLPRIASTKAKQD